MSSLQAVVQAAVQAGQASYVATMQDLLQQAVDGALWPAHRVSGCMYMPDVCGQLGDLTGASSLVLEESEVDTARVMSMTFGDDVEEPSGTHFVELAVADGTGKVSSYARNECRRRMMPDSHECLPVNAGAKQLYVCGTDEHNFICMAVRGARMWLAAEAELIVQELQVRGIGWGRTGQQGGTSHDISTVLGCVYVCGSCSCPR